MTRHQQPATTVGHGAMKQEEIEHVYQPGPVKRLFWHRGGRYYFFHKKLKGMFIGSCGRIVLK